MKDYPLAFLIVLLIVVIAQSCHRVPRFRATPPTIIDFPKPADSETGVTGKAKPQRIFSL